MRRSDVVTGGVLAVFAAAVALHAQTFPDIPGQQYGAAVFPTVVAVALGICGVLLVLRGWRAAPREPTPDRALSAHGILGFVGTVALVIFYGVAVGFLGFVPTMLIVILPLMIFLGVRWWVAAIVSLAVTFATFEIFTVLLRVPLPQGPLFG
ncbi:tripartite tricarboxylate transporter TctB family protein [Chelatococcus sp. GCM10030263]|uniref:tripartite tricarboxylate transporter TctB family protein n=1 Tax=Chelatococcus sp. GCM10030263 TaxID=3273387 RepID=UPI003623FB1E